MKTTVAATLMCSMRSYERFGHSAGEACMSTTVTNAICSGRFGKTRCSRKGAKLTTSYAFQPFGNVFGAQSMNPSTARLLSESHPPRSLTHISTHNANLGLDVRFFRTVTIGERTPAARSAND